MHLGKLLEILWTVFFRTQGDRVKENVATDATLQNPLHFSQMVRDHRTDILATGEHELDDHTLILDKIVVEVNLPAILGNKFHVGQVTPADELARRDVLEVVLLVLGRLIPTEQPGCAGNGGSCSCTRQQMSSCHLLCHDL